MNKKNLILALAVIAVLAIALLAYQSKTPKPSSSNQPQTQEEKPAFVAGAVTKVESNLVTFQVSTAGGPQERVAVISQSTQFTKQTVDKAGSIQIVPATSVDLKVGVRIIVFSADTDEAPIKADKIQIY